MLSKKITSDNQKIKYDPFTGFSQESKLTRTVYICRKSYYEEIFLSMIAESTNPPTALQHALGYEMTSRQPIWPLDQRLLKLEV